MKLENMTSRHIQIVNSLRQLPKKILLLYGRDNVTEFVLHELCNKDCFNVDKAAFFIDNPDFDHIKGIAGFSQNEAIQSPDIWKHPASFSQHMAQSPFNQKVRSFNCSSRKRACQSEQDLAQLIADEFELHKYHFYSWNMKHDNHGFLICQLIDDHDELLNDLMHDSMYFFSFCPVY